MRFLYWFSQIWATSNLSRQHVLDFALFPKIYKVFTFTLSKYAKKTLESYKNHTSTTRTLL